MSVSDPERSDTKAPLTMTDYFCKKSAGHCSISDICAVGSYEQDEGLLEKNCNAQYGSYTVKRAS